MKLTPHHIKETISLIVANASRQSREALNNYHNPDNIHYRDFEHCNIALESNKKQGHDRLQGLFYLFLEERQIVEHINAARNSITEEHGVLNALLTTGKHLKDVHPTDFDEVA